MTPTEGGERAGVAMAVLSAAVLAGCAYCYSLGRRVMQPVTQPPDGTVSDLPADPMEDVPDPVPASPLPGDTDN
jgi:hypothetical protein